MTQAVLDMPTKENVQSTRNSTLNSIIQCGNRDCKNYFHARRNTATYCSDACRVAEYRYRKDEKRAARRQERRDFWKAEAETCKYLPDLIALALAKYEQGYRYYKIDALTGEYICACIRDGKDVSLNNNLRPHLARLIEAADPRLANFFRHKEK